jgi:predicted metal-dependent peptidase|tara:strand:+ start:8462 stop:8806 length:345 start_codon:yes stop_codon:yes gene_type:complete
MAKKLTIPEHPMVVHSNLRTFEIKHKVMEGADGKLEFDESIMYLNPNQQTISLYKQTLLHELLHIVYELVGMDPEEEEDMPKYTNEFLVTVSTNTIMLLASMNQELFEFIFSKD